MPVISNKWFHVKIQKEVYLEWALSSCAGVVVVTEAAVQDGVNTKTDLNCSILACSLSGLQQSDTLSESQPQIQIEILLSSERLSSRASTLEYTDPSL